MTNLMQHSTTVLDISDDEAKADPHTRGKENIPPHELGIELPSSGQNTATVAAAARSSAKMEETRAPLGELDAADYYGEDCNAFSYAIVYDDEENSSEFKKPSSPLAQSQESLITTSIASVLETIIPVAAGSDDQQQEDACENAKPAV